MIKRNLIIIFRGKKVIERSDLQPLDMIDGVGTSSLHLSLMIGAEKQVSSSQIHMYVAIIYLFVIINITIFFGLYRFNLKI